jgi:hypothetical protein
MSKAIGQALGARPDGELKLYNYFNDIMVRNFILNGAPFQFKAANAWRRRLYARGDGEGAQ